MMTRKIIADQLIAYLRQQLSQAELVDWAERQVMDGAFDSNAARDAAAPLGVADVRAFGLTWDDCRDILRDLGFDAHVEVRAA
jgi:hypothetical protein